MRGSKYTVPLTEGCVWAVDACIFLNPTQYFTQAFMPLVSKICAKQPKMIWVTVRKAHWAHRDVSLICYCGGPEADDRIHSCFYAVLLSPLALEKIRFSLVHKDVEGQTRRRILCSGWHRNTCLQNNSDAKINTKKYYKTSCSKCTASQPANPGMLTHINSVITQDIPDQMSHIIKPEISTGRVPPHNVNYLAKRQTTESKADWIKKKKIH